MGNAEQVFLSEGADYFGNRLIYRNVDVGYKSDSGLSLNDHGEREFARLSSITDVEVKVVTEKPAKAPKKQVAKVEPEVPQPPEPSDLDDLLK